MKDFTTSAYIAPIIDEIERKFYIDRTSAEVKAIFKADLILSPASGSNDRYLITKDRENLLPGVESFKTAFIEIDNYTQAAETYAGELYTWSSREKDKLITAVYTSLLHKYMN